MQDFARALVENGLLTSEVYELWAARLTGQVGPDGKVHAHAPWDPWLNAEWRARPRDTREAIRDYYDSDAHIVLQDLFGGAWGDGGNALFDLGVEISARTLLDFGCGAGNFGRSCLSAGAVVSFADISPRILAGVRLMCEARSHGVRTFEHNDELPVDAFDIVVTTDALEHVMDPPTVLARLILALRPGGLFYQTTFFGGHDLAPYHLPENYRYSDEWLGLCEAAGLVRVSPRPGTRHDGLWRKV